VEYKCDSGSDSLKEALLYEKDDVRIIDSPMPEVGPTDILLKVKAAKVCPTDIRKYNLGSSDVRIRSLPMNLCHEYTGEIVDVGENVKTFENGMRVTGYGMKGNAEYVKLETVSSNPYFVNAILELPDNVTYEEGAFTTPFAECLHSIIDAADAVDLVPERLEVAKEMGADLVINASKEDVVEAVREFTDGEMANSSIATLGVPPVIQSAIDVTGEEARIVLFGGCPTGTIMQFDPNDIHYKERLLVGIEGIGVGRNRRPERRVQALRHIASGKINVNKLITHVMPMDDIVEAYEIMRRKEALSIVLNP
jgi:L-iditol 2-dehydrogenase